mmetsp:Transcript_38355/g.43792  ORF Transcript_38355/g.43792 Transcript_38355/m.43792 type:complete len:258 (-) Transcript_38355:76-849(-)
MVVFSCDGCGEVLKKSQVDAHAYRCRKCASVSCADCGVSYFGDDYRLHTTCITEAERYEKSVYRPPNNKKQKKNPQEVWMNLLQQCTETADAPQSIRCSLQRLADMGNVPRKEKQFRNFVANSLNLRGGRQQQSNHVNDLWNLLSERRNKEILMEKKKREEEEKILKHKEEEQKLSVEKTSLSSKQVRKTARKILKKSSSSSMKMKHLRNKVLETLGLEKSQQKKLKKILQNELGTKKFKIDGKMVKLAKNRKNEKS